MSTALRPRCVDGLVSIPLDLVRDARLSDGAVRLAAALDSWTFGLWPDVLAEPIEIARRTGLEPSEVGPLLDELVRTGWVAREPLAHLGRHRVKFLLLWRVPEDWFGERPEAAAVARGGTRDEDEDRDGEGGGR